MSTKAPNNSSILVAIAKLETKMDGLTIDVRDLKDGMKSDIEFLKVDKISRADAVRNQTEILGQVIDLKEEVKKLQDSVTGLEDSKIGYLAQLKVWVLLGGSVWTLATIVLSVYLTSKF